MSDTFKINDWAYDRTNKEYVKITNGIEEGSLEPGVGFVAKTLKPTEGIALRFMGIDSNYHVPILAFTYRKVEPANLTRTPNTGFTHIQEILDGPVNKKGKGNYIFIGRV